jgi:DNA-binding NarL/FixJ family response regulator
MISVAIVDDHVVTRSGIKTVLELSKEISVTIEASNGKELKEALESGKTVPDIVILDNSMPVMNGAQTIGFLTSNYPTTYILVFSMLYEEDSIVDMIARGACGYLSKSSDPDILIQAVKTVYSKGFYLNDLVKKEYFKNRPNRPNEKAKTGFYGKVPLTQKEVAFVRLAASSHSYAEIAALLEVRPKTIENYRDSVFQKLNINNRAALTVYAYKNGLIDFFQ